jgi:Leucine-rich repeat (LRR) protein
MSSENLASMIMPADIPWKRVQIFGSRDKEANGLSQLSVLKNLRNLRVEEFKPEALGVVKEFENLGSLELISVLKGSSSALSELLPRLRKLKSLTIRGLSDSSASLGNLDDLQQLQSLSLVRVNSLARHPEQMRAISRLKDLKSLTISNIDTLFINFGKLRRLQHLNFDESSFASLPKDIFVLPELTTLSVSSHRLQSLPDNEYRLSKLKHVNLKYGGLQKLPTAITRLTKLITLDVSFNAITTVPALGWENLRSIKETRPF